MKLCTSLLNKVHFRKKSWGVCIRVISKDFSATLRTFLESLSGIQGLGWKSLNSGISKFDVQSKPMIYLHYSMLNGKR